MAGRSQLPVQIMENQTRFDLNAAVENWRNELAAQPNLAPDDRRELETHLRDAIAGFQQRGLNDEESFWLARRRVGKPLELGEEFDKADPTRIWRGRIFFAAVALLAVPIWMEFSSYLTAVITILAYKVNHSNIMPDWVNAYFPMWAGRLYNDIPSLFLYIVLGISPVLFVVVLLMNGRAKRTISWLMFPFLSRRRFLVVTMTLFSIYFAWNIFIISHYIGQPTDQGFQVASYTCQTMVKNSIWPAVLVALIVWLMPPQNRKTPKRA